MSGNHKARTNAYTHFSAASSEDDMIAVGHLKNGKKEHQIGAEKEETK